MTGSMTRTADDIFDRSVKQTTEARNEGRTRFEPASKGQHAARLVDQIYEGKKSYQDNPPEDSFIFVYAIPERQVGDDGKDLGPKIVSHHLRPSYFGGDASRGYSPSKMMVMLRGISGNPRLSEDDLDRADFRLNKLLGRPCIINVAHRESAAGRTYATIVDFDPPAVGEDGKVEGGPTDLEAPSMDEYERPAFLQKRAYDPQRAERAAADNADVLAPAGSTGSDTGGHRDAAAALPPAEATGPRAVPDPPAGATGSDAGSRGPDAEPADADEGDIPF